MDRWKTLQSLNIKISKLIYNLINLNELFLYQDKFIFFEDYLVVQWLNYHWTKLLYKFGTQAPGNHKSVWTRLFMSFDAELDYAELRQSNFNSTTTIHTTIILIHSTTIYLFNDDSKCHILFIWYIYRYGAYHMPCYMAHTDWTTLTSSIMSRLRSHSQCCTEKWEVPFGFIFELFDWITTR